MEKQILLSYISPEELKQLIKEVIKEEFIDFKKNLDIKESDVLLTRSETCELLKLTAVHFGVGPRKEKLLAMVLPQDGIIKETKF
jgi:hypothetical protein